MAAKLILNPNDVPGMVKSLRDHFTGVQQVFMKMGEKLSPDARAQFDEIKSNVDAALVALADRPTEQIPAAGQAAWGLECMARTMIHLEEMRTSGQAMLEQITKQYGTANTELCSLRDRVEKKELVPAANVDAAVEAALKTERAKVAMFATRRAELMKANLPTPATDELLDGDDKAWSGRLAAATQRAEKLKGFGSGLETMGAEEKVDLLLGDEKAFNRTVKMATELSGLNGRAGVGEGEPLLGGGGGTGAGAAAGDGKGGEGKKRLFVG